jgi:hypothetical protein
MIFLPEKYNRCETGQEPGFVFIHYKISEKHFVGHEFSSLSIGIMGYVSNTA